jgi:hypothetical protein
MSSRIPFIAFAAALAAAGCSQDDPMSPSARYEAGEMPVESPSTSDEVAGVPAGVVATVSLANGGEIRFLDLGEGHIGFVERAPATAEFAAIAMVEREQATPLEVYLALRPGGADAPDRLVRDHARVAMTRGGTPAARLLTAPAAVPRSLNDPGRESYDCDPFGWQWIADWKAAFVGVTKYREAAHIHQLPTSYLFYPGAPVYYGTNTNSKTYLGVCNGDDDHPLDFALHRWISGKWKRFLTVRVYGDQKYTFYSGIPARYRGKLSGANGDTVEHLGFGAAWTLSPGLTP